MTDQKSCLKNYPRLIILQGWANDNARGKMPPLTFIVLPFYLFFVIHINYANHVCINNKVTLL